MSTNTLSAATDGQVIPAAHHNELVTALVGDFVPRNPSRIPADIAGQLGTSALRWERTYSKEFFIGTAAQNLKIYEGAVGEIWIERNASNKELIKLKNGSIELIVNNVLVGNFQQTTLDTPDKYLSYDGIKAKTKIVFANLASGYSGSFTNTFSTTFNDCKAGKRIKVHTNLRLYVTAFSSGQVRVRINSVVIRTFSSTPTGVETFDRSYLAVYTIPSNGNYTIELQYTDCEILAVSEILVEEV